MFVYYGIKLCGGSIDKVLSCISIVNLGVICVCPNGPGRQCTVYGACQQRCPNAVHRSHDGVPIICESGHECELVEDKQVMKCINKRRAETCSVTLDLELKYKHLLNKEFSPLVCQLIKMNQFTLCHLKIWVCSLRRNLQPQMYNEPVSYTHLTLPTIYSV